MAFIKWIESNWAENLGYIHIISGKINKQYKFGNTDRLCKLDSKRVASKKKTLQRSHSINGIFIHFKIDESIASPRLKRNFFQRSKPYKRMRKLILYNIVW